LLGHFELHRPLVFLHDDGASRDLTASDEIVDTQPNHIAATHPAIDGEWRLGASLHPNARQSR
jgi:hypothetical protein